MIVFIEDQRAATALLTACEKASLLPDTAVTKIVKTLEEAGMLERILTEGLEVDEDEKSRR